MKLEQLKNVMKEIEGPIQPSLQFQTNDYQKRVVHLNPLCEKGSALVYQFKTDARQDQTFTLVPDGCIDILFRCDTSNPHAVITGYQDKSSRCKLEPNQTYFGIKPYSGFLGLKHMNCTPAEFHGHQAALKSILQTEQLEERIAGASTMEERIELFRQCLLKTCLDETYISSLPGYISLCLCCSGGKVSLEKICEDTGYSSRYCRKVFSNSYGISIREYSQMIRFQRALRALCKEKNSIGEIAYDCGFFDEAHFVNNFKLLAGTTPLQFRRSILQTHV